MVLGDLSISCKLFTCVHGSVKSIAFLFSQCFCSNSFLLILHITNWYLLCFLSFLCYIYQFYLLYKFIYLQIAKFCCFFYWFFLSLLFIIVFLLYNLINFRFNLIKWNSDYWDISFLKWAFDTIHFFLSSFYQSINFNLFIYSLISLFTYVQVLETSILSHGLLRSILFIIPAVYKCLEMLHLFVLLLISSQIPVWLENFSCVWLCDPLDYGPPGSSVLGLLQARILEWVPFPSPGDFPDPGVEPRSPALQVNSLSSGHQRSPEHTLYVFNSLWLRRYFILVNVLCILDNKCFLLQVNGVVEMSVRSGWLMVSFHSSVFCWCVLVIMITKRGLLPQNLMVDLSIFLMRFFQSLFGALKFRIIMFSWWIDLFSIV